MTNELNSSKSDLNKQHAAVSPATSAASVPFNLLAKPHTGMSVNYSGMLKRARRSLEIGMRDSESAEMLRQFCDHLTELGQRWYGGDTAVVDELLQLYCVEKDARAALALNERLDQSQPAMAAEAVAWYVTWPGDPKETWCSVFVNERDAIQSASHHDNAEIVPLYAAPQHPAQADARDEDAYVAKRLSETLASVYTTIIGDDKVDESDGLNAIERVERAAQVLRLEVDLYRSQAAALATRDAGMAEERIVDMAAKHGIGPTSGLGFARALLNGAKQ